MKKYIGLLLLIISYNLSSQTIDIKTGHDFIQIKIYNSSRNLFISKLSKLDYLKFNNHKFTIPIQINNLILDEFQFPIALPEDQNYTIEKRFYAKNNLKNYSFTPNNVQYDLKKNLNKLNESIDIKKIGKQRGINVAIIKVNPFNFDLASNSFILFDSIEVKIKFKQSIQLSDFNSANPEYPFFSEFINKEHINELLKSKTNNKKNQIEKTLNESWYNPNKKFIKLLTKYDGIAKTSASEIIKIDTYFERKDLRFLHLLYKGEEVPIKILFDDDGFLNSNDEIIFLAHRAEGDTTWFNNYTDYSAFYLFYDDKAMGLRFNEFPDISAKNPLEFVNISKHIEYDTVYFHGDFNLQYDIENIHREGWYWFDMNSENKRQFSFDFINQLSDTVDIGINMLSLNWNKSSLTKHNFSILLNKDTITTAKLDTGNIFKFNYKIPLENIISGKNNLTILNSGNFSGIHKIIPDIFAVDYIELASKIKPAAYLGRFDFATDFLNENKKLSIPNYSNKNVILIDKKTNSIANKTGIVGTHIIAGAKNNQNPKSSIIINDSVFSNESNSLNIAILKSPDFKIEYKSFNEINNSVADFLNTANSGSIIVVTYNSNKQIPQNIVAKFQSLGSTTISQVRQGNSWVFISHIDNVIKAFEKFSTNTSSNLSQFIPHNNGKSFSIEQNLPANNSYDIVTSDFNSIEQSLIQPVNTSFLKNEDNFADAIYITHSKFKTGTDSLANYQKSKGHQITIVDIEDIYKEFNYGIKSTNAIKTFLRYAYNNWKKPTPRYLLIIGDGNWDSRNHLANSINIDYIPPYGWPVSDYWYTCLDDGIDYMNDMFVGRIPASENSQVINYLNKLKEYDSAPKMPWMKKFLSLTGGGAFGEKEGFKDNMDGILYSHWINTPFVGDTAVVAKKTDNTVGVAEANEIIQKIDNGAIWVNFYGHGAPDVFDMDGWHADKLNNKGKYPFFTTISCNTSAFAEPKGISRNESYLLIPDKGFIGTAGSTNLGVDIPGMQIVSNMMDIITDTLLNQRTLGEIVHNAKFNMLSYDPITRAYAQQFILLGDPMTKIKIPKTRDIYLLYNEVKITNNYGGNILIESDSTAIVKGFIYNNGFCEKNNLQLKLVHKYQDYSDTIFLNYQNLCIKETFQFDSLKILNKPGIHSLEIYCILTDTIFNIYQGNFEVFKSGLLPVEPLSYWNMNSINPFFRFLNPAPNQDIEYQFIITTINQNTEDTLYTSKISEIAIKENCIDWSPAIALDSNKQYYVYARYIQPSSSIESSWLKIPFSVNTDIEPEKVKVNLNNEFFNDFTIKNFSIQKDNGHKSFIFDDIKKEYQLISANGNDSTDRFCEISYDDNMYIITPSTSNAPVGINLITVSGIDGSYITTKKFNTWDGENSTVELVNFINDSIANGDWLLLSSCGSAWRMFYNTGKSNPEAIGSFNSFKKALADFGSILVNEIPDTTDIPDVSFTIAGRKGLPIGSAIEKIALDGSRISIEDSLTIFKNNGIIYSPIISSAKKWTNCIINANYNNSDISVQIDIFGVTNNYSATLLKSTKDTLNQDLSFINTQSYPSIFLILRIKRNIEDAQIKVNSFELNFTPSPEIAISNKLTKLNPDSVLRGEPSILNYHLENLSLRTTAENIPIQITVQPSGLPEMIYNDYVNDIKSNSSTNKELAIQTQQLTEENIVSTTINKFGAFNELYFLNNSSSKNLFLKRDNIKPTIKVKADGVLIHDSSYVSKRPYFEIELYDDSYEQIQPTVEPIKVWINSLRRNSNNSEDYKLELINDYGLKAVLGFWSDTLFDWDNRIEVVFRDAAGNTDTIEYHIFTSLNAYITEPKCEPNPITDNAKITFNYKASDNNGFALITISDVTGRIVKTLKHNLIIGKNEIELDGNTDYGSSISEGVYLYLIETKTPYYTEPVFGKFIKLK